MDATLAAYLAYLRAAGVALSVSDALVRDPDHVGSPHADGDRIRQVSLPGIPTFVEHALPGATLASDHATDSVARALVEHRLVLPGAPFWDVGCGTGVLAVVAALLGARPVRATDLVPEAVELADRNAREAGVEVETAVGSVLDPFPGDPVEGLVAANLPHKPSTQPGRLPITQDGGPDGGNLFGSLARQLSHRGCPGTRVLFFLHSLPHPRLLVRISDRFELTLLSWKLRHLAPGEFDGLEESWQVRSREGISYLVEQPSGHALVCGVWSARLI